MFHLNNPFKTKANYADAKQELIWTAASVTSEGVRTKTIFSFQKVGMIHLMMPSSQIVSLLARNARFAISAQILPVLWEGIR